MGAVWKVMAGLLLTLPVTAYITGTLVTAETDMPSERAPIVIPDSPREPQSPRPTTAPLDPDDGRREGDSDDDEVKVVRPTPDDLDDDEGREENRGDDGDSTDDGQGSDDGQEGDDDD